MRRLDNKKENNEVVDNKVEEQEKSSDKKNLDRDKTGVRDAYERIGEMFLAFVGVAYGICGGFMEILSSRESIAIIVISYVLYQSTSILEIFAYLFDSFFDGRR